MRRPVGGSGSRWLGDTGARVSGSSYGANANQGVPVADNAEPTVTNTDKGSKESVQQNPSSNRMQDPKLNFVKSGSVKEKILAFSIGQNSQVDGMNYDTMTLMSGSKKKM